MQVAWTYINENHLLYKGGWTLIGLIVTLLLIRVINRVLYSIMEHNNKYYVAKKRVYYFFSSVFVIFSVFLWLDSMDSLTTYFGLVSAGIAIALKDLFANIVAWLFIILRKPFEVSDRILINNQQGDVIDIRMFQFTLMEISSYEDGEQSTGRIINVPNYYIFVNSLINYNKGFKYIWNEIKVLITFESDWQKAKDILTNIINNHSLHLSEEASKMIQHAQKTYLIHYNKLTPIVYMDVKESGIQLTIRYLCIPRQRRTTVNDIWQDILQRFDKEENIKLAYPTIRVTPN
ncbi:MAG: mechanosensitive ion channel family protein [Anaeromicrobium sp.]|uniref:mechanosensitive ion channel family protein n=1 Tax=Anaeromicrobium sp. TaxID=1929132 RepID=UPI0025DE050B|nr:mechanosensitive ion channel family protein [Anaeromicrobium sp.]MCT4596190.1 mechanosensitive ion channel family protein [Anaeromicrobium sp.]